MRDQISHRVMVLSSRSDDETTTRRRRDDDETTTRRRRDDGDMTREHEPLRAEEQARPPRASPRRKERVQRRRRRCRRRWSLRSCAAPRPTSTRRHNKSKWLNGEFVVRPRTSNLATPELSFCRRGPGRLRGTAESGLLPIWHAQFRRIRRAPGPALPLLGGRAAGAVVAVVHSEMAASNIKNGDIDLFDIFLVSFDIFSAILGEKKTAPILEYSPVLGV